MNEAVPILALSETMTYAPSAGLYIDPILLLQYLDKRAILLAEHTAKPRLDALATELSRGQRLETLTLLTELEKVIKNAQP